MTKKTTIILPIGQETIITKENEDYTDLSKVLGEFDSISFTTNSVGETDHVIMIRKNLRWPESIETKDWTDELFALWDMRKELYHGEFYTFLPIEGAYTKILFENFDV